MTAVLRSAGAARGGLLAAALAATVACDGEVIHPRASISTLAPTLFAPPRVNFELVADALQISCGTLDCHGQPGRNLRLFGARGLRLDPRATPAEGRTTSDEYEASYWSLVALEPEVMSQVVATGGANPDRLTMVRKMRGSERHKGGQLATSGDTLDRCVTGWLAGAVDVDPCRAAARPSRPGSTAVAP